MYKYTPPILSNLFTSFLTAPLLFSLLKNMDQILGSLLELPAILLEDKILTQFHEKIF